MKRYVALAGIAFAVLAGAAVWLGGLNQDEGWYLYAAQLVAEGKKPYRDFFYTQGPMLPIIYSSLTWAWHGAGLLGARVLTCGIGLAATLFAAALARLLVNPERKPAAGTIAFLLLGCNLYHIYFTSIPKTYALASLFALMGYYLLACAFTELGGRFRRTLLFGSGLSLAFAAGTRISLGALLAVCGFGLLAMFRRCRWSFVWFGLGGALGLLTVYGPFVFDSAAFSGLAAAQRYHAARGGFDPVFTVGSVSRLVRWYLPVFVILGMGLFCSRRVIGGEAAVPRPEDGRRVAEPLLALGFLAVFTLQMLAPFPYEDYQVPVMGLLAAFAAVRFANAGAAAGLRPAFGALLALGLSFAGSFGSPLLERWMTNGQDRFWTLKKEKCELAQLREMAEIIEAVDPGGKTLLTQDTYLAVETGRKVPEGLEMGPFSVLSDDAWRKLLSTCECPIAALSGYTFAVEPPACAERDWARQAAYWKILKDRYELVLKEEAFGQNATTLLVLRRKDGR